MVGSTVCGTVSVFARQHHFIRLCGNVLWSKAANGGYVSYQNGYYSFLNEYMLLFIVVHELKSHL